MAAPIESTKTYRSELIRVPAGGSAWGEDPGWELYVDGERVARTPEHLPAEHAQRWANQQLAEGMNWLNGCADPTASWYWVA